MEKKEENADVKVSTTSEKKKAIETTGDRSATAANASSWAFRRQSRLFSSAHSDAAEVEEPPRPRRRAFAAIALTGDSSSSSSFTHSPSSSLTVTESRDETSSVRNDSSIEKEDEEDKKSDDAGNEAEDEDDEVFAAASRTRRRSRAPSNSFELTSSSYNRNRQLKLLRNVHSAQARLQRNNKHRSPDSLKAPSVFLSVDKAEDTIHPLRIHRLSPSPSLKVEVDDDDFYRLGGRRLSKLSSQTFDLGDDFQEEEEEEETFDSLPPKKLEQTQDKKSLSMKSFSMPSQGKKEATSFSATFSNFASSFLPSRLVNRNKSNSESSSPPTTASIPKMQASERSIDFPECDKKLNSEVLGPSDSRGDILEPDESQRSIRKKSIGTIGIHSASVSSASPSTIPRPLPPVNNRRGSAFFEGTSASFCVSELTPPSIVCTEHEENVAPDRDYSEEGRRVSEIPILDEFAQFLNASIHPPNELSVPRCYPDSPACQTSQTAPGSRRSSTSRGGSLSVPYRNARSLSLGYQQQQPPPQQSSHPIPTKNNFPYLRGVSFSGPTANSPSGASPTSRPVLRRESAQDCGDEETFSRLHPTLPDLKIDLLPVDSLGTLSISTTGTTTSMKVSSSMPTSSNPSNPYRPPLNTLSPNPSELGANLYQRRHSNCMRGSNRAMTRNKSAPATPLNRSMSNVMRISRSPSRDGYLMVPADSSRRVRGSSLPEGQDNDLYCLRQFTVSNKRVVNRGDSLQPRHCRSNSSIYSSGSSLSYSHSGHSGRSSLKSSTEDEEQPLSRDGSLGGSGGSSRFTVIMLGATDVGKSLLTSQFMSSNDVGGYINEGQDDEYGEKYVSVLLEGEESELVFIDRPSAEISVENAISTYVPDAMIVVFSVVNMESLKTAESILQYLWRTGSNTDKAVIMVGNKSDLVRSRVVPIVDAKAIASSYDCKYTETSAALNHNVDELLVGTLTQIRLKLAERHRCLRKGRKAMISGAPGSFSSGNAGGNNLSLSVQTTGANFRRKSAGIRVKGILDKVLKGESKSKSCDDLHVL